VYFSYSHALEETGVRLTSRPLASAAVISDLARYAGLEHQPNPDTLQQFFKVGGIGSVVIGRVEAGEIKRGMKLVAAPGVATTLAAQSFFLILARATPVSRKKRCIAIAQSK
jgi:hypothetical protein